MMSKPKRYIIALVFLVLFSPELAQSKIKVYFNLTERVDLKNIIMQQINQATKSIDVGMYYFTLKDVADKLLEEAYHKPQLKIRVLLDLSQIYRDYGTRGHYIEAVAKSDYLEAIKEDAAYETQTGNSVLGNFLNYIEGVFERGKREAKVGGFDKRAYEKIVTKLLNYWQKGAQMLEAFKGNKSNGFYRDLNDRQRRLKDLFNEALFKDLKTLAENGKKFDESLYQKIYQELKKKIEKEFYEKTLEDFIAALKKRFNNQPIPNIEVKYMWDKDGWGWDEENKRFGLLPWKARKFHHKACIIDRKILFTGSYNWTYAAGTKNFENATLIYQDINAEDQAREAQDQKLIDDFQAEFDASWETKEVAKSLIDCLQLRAKVIAQLQQEKLAKDKWLVEIEALQRELEKLKAENEDLRLKKEDLKEEKKQLEAEKEKLKEETEEELQAEVQRLREEIKQLKTKIEQLKIEKKTQGNTQPLPPSKGP